MKKSLQITHIGITFMFHGSISAASIIHIRRGRWGGGIDHTNLPMANDKKCIELLSIILISLDYIYHGISFVANIIVPQWCGV